MKRVSALARSAACALALVATTAGAADAKRLGLKYGPHIVAGQSFSYDVITKHPTEGYEGPIGSPLQGGYCSYHKYPVRKCSTASNGQRRCKAAAWRLHQFCTFDRQPLRRRGIGLSLGIDF